MKKGAIVSAVMLALPLILGAQRGPDPRIQIVQRDAARRVDVIVDGKPFTSYIYPTTLKKPVLHPLRTANGIAVTRGFPLEPKAGERVDHPHHAGLWFNHGDVNGLDFWNNSDDIAADRVSKMGTIVHRRVVEAKGGNNQGSLIVEMDWIGPDKAVIVHERTQFLFGGGADRRSVDRITSLTAANGPVVFRDNKEGVLGLRVTRALEQPADKPEVFTDASGKPTKMAVLDNTGVTGLYTSSEGLKGDAVWGTRGRWTALHGIVERQPVTVVMLDHPSNPGYPTYWHARGYGLFSANPLGRKVFDDKQQALVITLKPQETLTFRHRVLILNETASADTIDRQHQLFAGATSR